MHNIHRSDFEKWDRQTIEEIHFFLGEGGRAEGNAAIPAMSVGFMMLALGLLVSGDHFPLGPEVLFLVRVNSVLDILFFGNKRSIGP